MSPAIEYRFALLMLSCPISLPTNDIKASCRLIGSPVIGQWFTEAEARSILDGQVCVDLLCVERQSDKAKQEENEEFRINVNDYRKGWLQILRNQSLHIFPMETNAIEYSSNILSGQ
jgi:hypothetical protein